MTKQIGTSTTNEFDETSFYYAALLHLRSQTRIFAHAFASAKQAAVLYESQGHSEDLFAKLVAEGIIQELRMQIELNPGLAQILSLVLKEKLPSAPASSS